MSGEENLDSVAKKIKDEFKGFGSALVAFSGGVDSSVVASLAYSSLKDEALAVTVDSKLISSSEIDAAIDIANEIGIKHRTVKLDISKKVESNPTDRCYHCKKAVLSHLKKIASKEGIGVVADGTNASETRGHRPGHKAIEELGIFTPLADFNLEKEDIRMLARKLGLPNSEKPSMSCLATRIPYNEKIDGEKLSKIERAEEFLRKKGFEQLRVRIHDGNLARIELAEDKIDEALDIRQEIVEKFKSIGINYVSIDLEGYRSGSMDELMGQ